MKTAPLPEDEPERLAMLKEYEILDTAAERVFDTVTELAAKVCDVPIALISLVDARRQWFKSAHGLRDLSETSRDLSFCAHAILSGDVMEVADATLDPRFHDNPLVTDNPSIRFYSGAPLHHSSGLVSGTLCVIDRRPKRLSAEQRDMLQRLSETVVALFDARRAMSRMARLGIVLDNSFSEVCVLGKKDRRFAYINQSARRNLQYSTEELSGMTPAELTPELNMAGFAALIAPLDSGAEESIGFETRHRRKDSSTYPVEARLQVSRFEDAAAFVAIINDISARKQAEQALRESERRFRTMADAAPVLIWTTNADKQRDYVNRSLLAFTGRTLEQELGECWMEAVHPDDLCSVLAAFHFAVDARWPFCLEYRLRHGSGEYRWVTDNGVPRFHDDGNFAGFIGSAVDIDESKRNLHALHASQERLRIIADSIPAPIAHIDHGPALSLRNCAYEDWFGLDPRRMLGAPVREVFGGHITTTSIPQRRQPSANGVENQAGGVADA